jgi:PBP1b-binding outer membrane lipoprotein LpoB
MTRLFGILLLGLALFLTGCEKSNKTDATKQNMQQGTTPPPPPPPPPPPS